MLNTLVSLTKKKKKHLDLFSKFKIYGSKPINKTNRPDWIRLLLCRHKRLPSCSLGGGASKGAINLSIAAVSPIHSFPQLAVTR